MKKITNFILEKLQLNKNSVLVQNSGFTDEELRKDYDDVANVFTKAEKQKYAKKYSIETNKFREIQIEILKCLRMNRQKKKEFDNNDIKDFLRFDIKEKEQDLISYMEQEPVEFIKVLYSKYKEKCKREQIGPYANSYTRNKSNLSIANRYILRKFEIVKKYLDKMGELPK